MKLRSVDICPKTCNCCICGNDGKVLKRCGVKKGEKLPPTQDSGSYYEIEE